jgi:SagB-type dehydrogenase family enzyme
MKKIFLYLSALVCCAATAQNVIPLPNPNPLEASKMTLMQTLMQRHSVRSYSDKNIDTQTLSTLLWAACGINRPAEKRITAPSAINGQDISVYVCRKEGAYRYLPLDNTLEKVSDEDLRTAVAGGQDFAQTAPICLVLVSDVSKVRSHQSLSNMDAGFVSENICLACTAMGLATVPRATMDQDALHQKLKLTETQIPILNNPVGWPKK